ncbi:putative F-box domain-containing protein [Rosa chinensis]|uniref:Putative F-box domain-containing protein n=1 Tax=Rosa chinensis TaxID=74649 RepID=A0A2P6S055_ROSCH|nr:putative F-box domain-containing protein [Rosa chinensis]
MSLGFEIFRIQQKLDFIGVIPFRVVFDIYYSFLYIPILFSLLLLSSLPSAAAAMGRHCGTNATKRLLNVPSGSQSHVKKSKSSPETPWQSKLKTSIDHLPDMLLVEILCRLPHNKFAFQCKCVCKRWSSLISDEKFQCRFLWLQSRQDQKPTPVGRTIIFRDAKDMRKFFILPELELPMFKTHNFSLSFLRCFEPPEFIETDDDIDDGPIVVGTCNDLVLCCETTTFQSCYYICNPCTKQFVHLPPTPRRYKEVRVGFICDPYYKEDGDDQKEESDIIQVDADFRYAVVRIGPCSSPFKFNLEIFSSETGKWTESTIMSTCNFRLDNLNRSGGVPYNGMLYWLNADYQDAFIVGLDPYYYSNKNNNDECPGFHFIELPERYGQFPFLAVCGGGRLRICHFFTNQLRVPIPFSHETIDVPMPCMSVWELKDDVDDDVNDWYNLTGIIDLSTMVFGNPLTREWGFYSKTPLLDSIMVLAFDPNNEDILYLELFDHIVACNISERAIKGTTLTIPYRSTVRFGRGVFPFVIPKWPTPPPRL